MRFKTVMLMMTLAAGTPAAASAATCVQIYQTCLNDTYDTSGITRILADLECAAKYVGCIRAAVV